jgi:hypothetical protein
MRGVGFGVAWSGWSGPRLVVALPSLACVALLWLLPSPALAGSVAELQSLGRDDAGQVDRYRVTFGSGATLWDVAQDALPLVALDQGDKQAYQMALQSFQREYPDRRPDQLQPGETFTLEVPVGTFVTQEQAADGDQVVYRSFQGDQLSYFPKDPALLYRLVHPDNPDRAEVRLSTQDGAPEDLARAVFQVDSPDFIQVRAMSGALADTSQRLLVDTKRKYLDDFRNYRERAVDVRDGPDGRKLYLFGENDRDNPYAVVEDGVGDGTDPTQFPHLFRLAYYRNGYVRLFVLTQPGDTLSTWTSPDPDTWHQALPGVKDWQEGKVEPLPPFTPPVDNSGRLNPGRILVVRFAPQRAQPSSGIAGTGLNCAGAPAALVLSGLGLRFRPRRLRRLSLPRRRG